MKKVLLVSTIAISSMFVAIGCGGDKAAEGDDGKKKDETEKKEPAK